MTKLLAVGVILFLSCKSNNNSTKEEPKYDTVKVDTDFKNQIAFELFDYYNDLKETNDSGEEFKAKKSCEVMAVTINDAKDRFYPHTYEDCEALLRKDTLTIVIGSNSGFSGSGIEIYVVGGKFHAEPYEFSDVVTLNEKKPAFKVESQKLVLSNTNFAIGDSVYGHIYSRAQDDRNLRYYAMGFFRTKVVERK